MEAARTALQQMPISIRRTLVLVALAVLATGCGATCEQLKAERAAVMSGSASLAAGPHLEIVVPLEELNSRLKSAALSLKTRRLFLPGFKALGVFSGGFVVKVQSLSLNAGTGGSLGFKARVRLRYKKKNLATLHLHFEVSVTAALDKGRLVLGLGDLRGPPRFTGDTADRMAKILHPLLPGPLRKVITKARIRSLCKAGLRQLEEETMELLGEPLVEPLLRAARTTVRLPDWPITEVAISTRKGTEDSLVIAVTTGLSDAASVPKGARTTRRDGWIWILVPGPTAAALANYMAEIGRGGLPSRVNATGTPDPNGELAVTYGWCSGQRPLKLYLWRLKAPCAALRLGGTPEVRVDDHAVHMGVYDGRVERVRGGLLVKAGVFINDLWSRVFRVEVEALRRVRIKIAGEILDLSVEAVTLDEDGWAVALSVRDRKAP